MVRRTMRRGPGSSKGRIILALIVAAISLITYFGAREYHPVTDEVQHVDLTVQQEVALGLQAAPQMAAQHGVRFLAEAGYDPRALIRVMEVLEQAGEGQAQPPEFFSTHPNPSQRLERIQQAIAQVFPDGVPEGLTG